MEEGDEFYEDVKRIEKKWYIGDILDVKEQKKLGEIVNRNPAYVGRGDFVDMEVVSPVVEVGVRRTKSSECLSLACTI